MKHEEDEALRERSRAEGVVYAIAALGIAGVATFHLQEFWWLYFIAFGLAMKAAKIFGREHPNPERSTAPVDTTRATTSEAASKRAKATAAPEADPTEAAKVDALCDRLKADIASSPAVAKEILREPEKTVEALRTSCHALLKRKAEVDALVDHDEVRKLEDELAGLRKRIEAEADPVTSERLSAAASSLETLLEQRGDLSRLSGRIEAEYTRLYYTLQNLHTQVLRVRSADLASEGAQLDMLRRTTEQLASEMDAVAQALESPDLALRAPAPIAEIRERDASGSGDPVPVR